METQLENSDLIDWTIFGELIQMDEDEEGFSKSLVTTFVEQLLDIFDEMDQVIDNVKSDSISDEELVKLSNLGHYLKGSLLLLGLKKIQNQCEFIQNFGNKINNNNIENNDKIANGKSLNNDDWLDLIKDALQLVKLEFTRTRSLLSDYFGEKL